MVDKSTIAKNIGANLKKIRIAKGHSMQQLADIAEIEKSQIVRIESAKVDVRVSSLFILAQALEVDVKEFFD